MTARHTPAECGLVCRDGGVVLYPTEGVWGLGCSPLDEDAVMRILELKARSVSKGLILIAASIAQLMPYLDIDAISEDRWDAISDSWPGANTWVIPASELVPAYIRGDFDSVAVRVTSHPAVRDMCNSFGGALVSTSANVAGDPSPLTLADVDKSVRHGVDAVCEGETLGSGVASTIRDALTGDVLR